MASRRYRRPEPGDQHVPPRCAGDPRSGRGSPRSLPGVARPGLRMGRTAPVMLGRMATSASNPLVAPLSSIGSTVNDLVGRISGLADGERAADHEDTVAALEEVERLLRSTSRRLSRLLRELDRRR